MQQLSSKLLSLILKRDNVFEFNFIIFDMYFISFNEKLLEDKFNFTIEFWNKLIYGGIKKEIAFCKFELFKINSFILSLLSNNFASINPFTMILSSKGFNLYFFINFFILSPLFPNKSSNFIFSKSNFFFGNSLFDKSKIKWFSSFTSRSLL